MNQEHIINSKHERVLEAIAFLKAETVRTKYEHLTEEAVYENLIAAGCKVFHTIGVTQDKSELIHEIVVLHPGDEEVDEYESFEEYVIEVLNNIQDEWGQHWINVVSLPHEIYSQLKNFK
jgi:sulfatase maturation enzyme AslB (radical SAM superfamily)